MNKLIIKEAFKAGIKLENGNLVFNSQRVNINIFINEVTKLRFSIPIQQAVTLCKTKLFCNPSIKNVLED